MSYRITMRTASVTIALFGFVFCLLALSNPGRLDIVDAQTRYAVGESLYERGDSTIRDERVWWSVFPGRDDRMYSLYRLPHSLVAVGAIAVADATGGVSEGRRHFAFMLASSVAGGLLSLVYFAWFVRRGRSMRSAILWSLGGIVCTPAWFYSTSGFDDIFGALGVVAAVVLAGGWRCCAIVRAIVCGAILAVACNFKQPLAVFLLPVLAILDDRGATRGSRLLRAVLVVAGSIAGLAFEKGYQSYKFPFDFWTVNADFLKGYIGLWSGNPLPALACLALSPGAGAIWYSPTLYHSLLGTMRATSGSPLVRYALIASAAIFVGFFACLTFFKGDLSWGPRYLVPPIAVLWLWIPEGLARTPAIRAKALLAVAVLVQALGVSVDPHRLYIEREIPMGLGAVWPWMYFYPQASHLVQRPREIVQILQSTSSAEAFSPAPSPTFAIDAVDPWKPNGEEIPERVRPYHIVSARSRIPAEVAEGQGPTIVRRYTILNSLRPWWHTFRNDPAPVDYDATLLVLLAGLLFAGKALYFIPRRS